MYIHENISGVEKKNDDTKRNYFRASNKWNATKDILENDYKLHVLAAKERIQCNYKYNMAIQPQYCFMYVNHLPYV